MEQKSNGALISSIIVIALIVIGGIFLWMTSMKHGVDGQQTAPTEYGVSNTSGDEEFASIDEDLNGMDMDGLDEGM